MEGPGFLTKEVPGPEADGKLFSGHFFGNPHKIRIWSLEEGCTSWLRQWNVKNSLDPLTVNKEVEPS